MNHGMTISAIEQWANRNGVNVDDAWQIRNLMRKRHWQETRALNGDYHPGMPNNSDKNANMLAWDKVVDKTLSKIQALLTPYGMTFDPGTGLWGSIIKDGRYVDDVPDRD